MKRNFIQSDCYAIHTKSVMYFNIKQALIIVIILRFTNYINYILLFSLNITKGAKFQSNYVFVITTGM